MEGGWKGAAGKSVGASLGCKLPAAGADGVGGAGHRSGAEFGDGDWGCRSLRQRARGSGSAHSPGMIWS